MPTIRKEMPGVEISREQFVERMRRRFFDPAFGSLASEVDKIIGVAWDARRPRLRRSELQIVGRMAGRERADQTGAASPPRTVGTFAHPADQRSCPQRAHLPG